MLLFNEGGKKNKVNWCCIHDYWEINSGIIETLEINGLLGLTGKYNFPSDFPVNAFPVFPGKSRCFPGVLTCFPLERHKYLSS